MSVAAPPVPRLMTAEEFLALPDDGVERWLSRGRLMENRGTDMTVRNRFHSRLTIRVGHVLERWVETLPEPRGQVVGGEAGFILRRDPDTTVGIDVAYVGPDVVAVQSDDTTLFDGRPTLAVEILSPGTTHGEWTAKVRDYLACGVPLVWVIDPNFRIVTVCRPAAPAEAFNEAATIPADPHLPGFSVTVRDLFR